MAAVAGAVPTKTWHPRGIFSVRVLASAAPAPSAPVHLTGSGNKALKGSFGFPRTRSNRGNRKQSNKNKHEPSSISACVHWGKASDVCSIIHVRHACKMLARDSAECKLPPLADGI